MRRAARRDATHGPLAKRFVSQGCSVVTLPAVLGGLPDLLVGCARANHLVEVKNPASDYGRDGMSPVQREWALAWRGAKPEVVATDADVDALVARWRSRGGA